MGASRFLLTFVVVVAVASRTAPAAAPVQARAIIGYVFAQDATIRPGQIAAGRLTHINYAFANIRDGEVVEGFAHDVENLRVLTGLRRDHPRLKVLISVGGWTWSGGFSDAALTADSRRRFVYSAIDFVRRHDLDGFDVDWEYPGQPGFGNRYRAKDKEHFTALMSELRTALDAEGAARGRKYVLTFAAGADAEFLAHTEMRKVQASVDYVNLMTYDFREADWSPLTGHHANLFPNPRDDTRQSADRSVRSFIAAGVPARKLVLGIPFYGHAWGNVTSKTNGLYQPGRPLAEEMDTGYGRLATDVIGRNGFKRFWDPQARAPYLWNAARRIFITYDDPASVTEKARYIRDRGLGGAMFWQYFEDPSGALLGVLYGGLRNASSEP